MIAERETNRKDKQNKHDQKHYNDSSCKRDHKKKTLLFQKEEKDWLSAVGSP